MQVETKNFKKTWKQLFVYINEYIPVMVVILLFSVIASILQVLGPNKLKDLTNLIAEGLPQMIEGVPILNSIDLVAIRSVVLLLLTFYGVSAGIDFIRSFVMAGITQRITKKMRTEINHKIHKLPIKYFDSVSFGDVLSRITNDVDVIGQTLNQSIATLVSAVTMFFGTLIMMFYNSWILALVAISTTLIGFVLMFLIIKHSQKYFAQQQKSLGELNGHIEEAYSGHNVIKAYNAGAQNVQDFKVINESLRQSAWKSQFLSGLMQPLMQFIGNFGYVAVSITGAALVMGGSITFGVVVAFMTYIRLFTQPLSQIAQATNRLQSAAAASERVFEFLQEQEEKDESNLRQIYPKVKGNVSFKEISFGYDRNNPVLKNFSDEVKAGEKIAIVGPTGAGKTTLVNLLMRFYDVDSGIIEIDGFDIQKVPRNILREQFSMVLQDTWIFEGSIMENIRFNQEDISDETVIELQRVLIISSIHYLMDTTQS